MDPDLVAGAQDGGFTTFMNRAGCFTPRTGAANRLNTRDAGERSTAALVDLDADGLLDLLTGNTIGTFSYFENTGTATSPVFALCTGTANPFLDLAPAYYTSPAIGNFDRDGDPNLVTGALSGTFAVHYFPEPARNLLAAVGAALVGWPARRRARSRPLTPSRATASAMSGLAPGPRSTCTAAVPREPAILLAFCACRIQAGRRHPPVHRGHYPEGGPLEKPSDRCRRAEKDPSVAAPPADRVVGHHARARLARGVRARRLRLLGLLG
jgi:hypothetical protein